MDKEIGMDRKIEKKKWPPKKIATLAFVALFFVIVVYNISFGDRSSRLNVEEQKITISEVREGPFQEFIPVTGNVLRYVAGLSRYGHGQTEADCRYPRDASCHFLFSPIRCVHRMGRLPGESYSVY